MSFVLNPLTGQFDIVGTAGGGGSGTVTSVGLNLPALLFTITNSPVTTSGTLTGTLRTQLANSVFAGPTTGSAASPTFRSLVAADIPSLPYSTTNYLPQAVYTLTNTDITNKFVTLSTTPTTANLVRLTVVGGPEQAYGDDFTVSSNQLSWSGLFLDGVLTSGDKLIITLE